MTDPALWLTDRAESYARDARAFREMGDKSMAVAYSAIAAELRDCAKALKNQEVSA